MSDRCRAVIVDMSGKTHYTAWTVSLMNAMTLGYELARKRSFKIKNMNGEVEALDVERRALAPSQAHNNTERTSDDL